METTQTISGTLPTHRDFYIVVGEQGTGKSSVIRSLINCIVAKKDIDCTKIINTKNGYLEIFCKSQSLQEAGINIKSLSTFLGNISAPSIVIALRTRPVKKRKSPKQTFPDATAYISAFANFGQIKYVVELTANSASTLQAYCTKNNHQNYYHFSPFPSCQPQSMFVNTITSIKNLFGF